MTMRWNVGTKIGAGFGLALVILVVIGGVSYRSIAKLTETAELVAHTHQVLDNLEVVVSDMKDAETGQRGYLITGEERYLAPFRAALAVTNQDLKALRTLTSDNVNQQRRLDLLEPLINGKEGKFAELQETIDARRDKAKGFAAALQIVLTDKGKKVMDDIRKTADEMRSEENALLRTRSDEAEASARNTRLTIIVGTLAAVIALALAGFVITRNIARPLRNLTTVAERITAGDLKVDVSPDTRTDEVGVLARTFDRMTRISAHDGRCGGADRRRRLALHHHPTIPQRCPGQRVCADGRKSSRADSPARRRRQCARRGGQRDCRVDHATGIQRQRVRRRRERNDDHGGRSPANRADGQPEGQDLSPTARRRRRRSRKAAASPPRMSAPA